MRDKMILSMNIFILFFNITILFSSNYIVELIVSFLPQILFLEILYILFYSVFLWKIKFENIYNILNGQVSISILSLGASLFFFISFFLISYKVYSFSLLVPTDIQNVSQNTSIRIVFFNKKYSNNNYGIISKKISELDPDIIAIAECEFGCETKILALSKFESSSKSIGDPSFPVILLSKYKLENIELDKTFDSVSAEIVKNNKKIGIFAVHPLAPVLPSTFTIRNDQLELLSKNVNKSNSEYKVIFGDFNLSPWTTIYDKFVNSTNNIYDSAKGKGINTTWGTSGFFNLLPLRTHIDHIFLSKNIYLKEFEVLGNYESDHSMIVTDISL